MKKQFLIGLLFIGFLAVPLRTCAQDTEIPSAKQPQTETQKLTISFLYPEIRKAIEEYYQPYLTLAPRDDPWFIKILSIQNRKSYDYIIRLEVNPYIGPHDTVGTDQLTFSVKPFSEGIKLINFQHLKSYPIAPNLQGIIKEWPPVSE